MLIAKESTESTNDDARALALSGAAHGTAVLAAQQTRGRGRAGRAWLSPAGGLYLSVVLRPDAPVTQWGLLPLALGAAVVRVLRGLGFDVGLKWPNDLLVGSHKVGGLLVESRLDAHPFAVAGLGLNLHDAPAGESTCLGDLGEVPPMEELAEEIVAAFMETTRRIDEGETSALRDDVAELCVSLGKWVEWDGGKGIAVDVSEDGSLIVESDGARERVIAGDVRLRWAQ